MLGVKEDSVMKFVPQELTVQVKRGNREVLQAG